MSDPEAVPAIEPQGEQTLRSEASERRRLHIVTVGFFTFFIILWLIIHFINRALTNEGPAAGGQFRFRIVEIPTGSGLSDIADRLAAHGIIDCEFLFMVAATLRQSTRDLKAGEYSFETSMSLIEVLAWLEQGHVILHKFTIPEGFTIKQIGRLVGKLNLADEAEFMRLAEDPELCSELGVEEPSLEGYLFPDTYKIAKGLPTKKVIRIMVDRFRDICLGELREEIAASQYDLRDLLIIASIIEKEALFEDEEPLIAGVIYNRLRRNMPLQCDVTIRYPLDNYGAHLTYADLEMNSPYNSYLFSGLPPTPICNPGFSAVRAALNPADTNYFYFVSMNNGRHKFSESLEEHNKAVYKYQILNERG
jgi:UPF0755 protein